MRTRAGDGRPSPSTPSLARRARSSLCPREGRRRRPRAADRPRGSRPATRRGAGGPTVGGPRSPQEGGALAAPLAPLPPPPAAVATRAPRAARPRVAAKACSSRPAPTATVGLAQPPRRSPRPRRLRRQPPGSAARTLDPRHGLSVAPASPPAATGPPRRGLAWQQKPCRGAQASRRPPGGWGHAASPDTPRVPRRVVPSTPFSRRPRKSSAPRLA